MPFTRRAAIKWGVASGAGASFAYALARLRRPETRQPVFPIDPALSPDETFPQSVASADPTPSGAIVWTRVAPERIMPDTPLGLEVAEDPRFERVVRRAAVPSTLVSPETDHTVRVDLDGLLEHDRHYHFRFVYRGAASRTGRLRTLPPPGADPDRLRLAVVTCQAFFSGYYGAYRHIADDEVDLIVHLGDIVYEYASAGRVAGRVVELPSGETRATDLEDFRYLHRLARSDRSFQAALERHTLVAGWDDHEVANNRYWDYDKDRPRFPGHPADEDADDARKLLAGAVQAWWEYVPARVRYQPGLDHPHERFQLYRTLRFGTLAELFVADERLYRHGPPCASADPAGLFTPDCAERMDAARTMLGPEQRDWLVRGLTTSPTRWKVWANAVVLQPIRLFGPADLVRVYTDAWEGYPAERRAIFDALSAAGTHDVVALTGDMHTFLAGYLQLDYDDTRADPLTNRVGIELMTPAVTSDNFATAEADPTGAYVTGDEARMRALNPHLVFFRNTGHGYCVVDLTRQACTYTAYLVDRDTRDAPREVLKVLRTPSGRVELEDVTPAPSPRPSRAAPVPPRAAPRS